MTLKAKTIKLLPETLETYQGARENSEAETENAFVELLLEAYLNPKTKPVVPEGYLSPEQVTGKMLLLQNQIGQLKTGKTLREDELENRVKELEGQLEEKENQPPIQLDYKPGDNQVLIDLPPVVAIVLDKERVLAGKQAGKEVTRGQLLLDAFWTGIVNGASYPIKTWTSSELRAIKHQLKEQESNAE